MLSFAVWAGNYRAVHTTGDPERSPCVTHAPTVSGEQAGNESETFFHDLIGTGRTDATPVTQFVRRSPIMPLDVVAPLLGKAFHPSLLLEHLSIACPNSHEPRAQAQHGGGRGLPLRTLFWPQKHQDSLGQYGLFLEVRDPSDGFRE